MKRVIIESPFWASSAAGIERHIEYARAAVRDSVLRGEAPIASHLLFTQPGILKDDIPEERTMGINAGHAWMPIADLVAVYGDLGISRGMKIGIELADKFGIKVQYRQLRPELKVEDKKPEDDKLRFQINEIYKLRNGLNIKLIKIDGPKEWRFLIGEVLSDHSDIFAAGSKITFCPDGNYQLDRESCLDIIGLAGK